MRSNNNNNKIEEMNKHIELTDLNNNAIIPHQTSDIPTSNNNNDSVLIFLPATRLIKEKNYEFKRKLLNDEKMYLCHTMSKYDFVFLEKLNKQYGYGKEKYAKPFRCQSDMDDNKKYIILIAEETWLTVKKEHDNLPQSEFTLIVKYKNKSELRYVFQLRHYYGSHETYYSNEISDSAVAIQRLKGYSTGLIIQEFNNRIMINKENIQTLLNNNYFTVEWNKNKMIPAEFQEKSSLNRGTSGSISNFSIYNRTTVLSINEMESHKRKHESTHSNSNAINTNQTSAVATPNSKRIAISELINTSDENDFIMQADIIPLAKKGL